MKEEAVQICRCPRCNSKKTAWYPYKSTCVCEKCGLTLDPIMVARTRPNSTLEFWYYPKNSDNIDEWALVWYDLDSMSVPFGIDPLEYVRHLDAIRRPDLKDRIMDERLNAYLHSIWTTKRTQAKAVNRWVGAYSSWAADMDKTARRDDFIEKTPKELLDKPPYKGMMELFNEEIEKKSREG